MSLSNLLGLWSRDQITEGETLPAYMNRLTTPSRPNWRPEDIVDNVLAEHRDAEREERRTQAAYDRAAMLERIRAKRSNPQPGELERQHRVNERLDAAAAALQGDYDE
jgi:hypothetical protein